MQRAEPEYRSMMARVVRAAIFCATMLVAWTVAHPAHASSAPFCDDRGATALAAPPALEAPDEAIRRARVAGCEHKVGIDVLMASLGPSHGQAGAAADDPGPVCPISAAILGPVLFGALLSVEPPGRPSVGTRSRVERPPRG